MRTSIKSQLQKLKWFTPEHVSGTSSETEDIYRYLPSPGGAKVQEALKGNRVVSQIFMRPKLKSEKSAWTEED